MTLRFFLLFCLIFSELQAQPSDAGVPDVLQYKLSLEPDIEAQTIHGEVSIRFQVESHAQEVAFDCGALSVTKVEGAAVKSFHQQGQQLFIQFTESVATEREVHISYHGKPQRGLIFLEEVQQAYTVYFTSEWMVCHDQISDRASINMSIIVPANLSCVASGTLSEKKKVQDKIQYSWRQEQATPAYTYGFAIGTFHELVEHQGSTDLRYYAAKHSAEELAEIFKSSADMLRFLEEKSGVPYFQTSYTQILMGDHFQEMSGFAVMKENYGEMILQDSTEINLIAHEMAHQWWGNMITCENLGHFWLNEGFATYMSAAYNEHRFGRDKYMENINAYHEVYQKIKDKGVDKSLVFKNWNNPSADDRSLVYFKGAYVLHLLREEMEDDAFWEGIRHYSRKFYGKSVLSKDFQKAMEDSSSRDLNAFFNAWVY
ncbi:aminopeptidase N [Catalinimonas alkaloidigena]|uniref:M1 family metallopeptidase n=1 Tax=Catalinimonas alkaloidigena TaxID=1075417 RepID=UPI002405B823|nr:M1 family metallopeptidase [Catalinimonas alkaloidigena]MDF9800988.1 aminopeptidase N [Catalinimonas alkaloidigena]